MESMESCTTWSDTRTRFPDKGTAEHIRYITDESPRRMKAEPEENEIRKSGREKMKKFNYTMNHKADEAYMAEMCHKGLAAVSLVEGVWTFEPCRPDQYVYRVGYLRGMRKSEIEAQNRELAAKGITFVSRYSFWAIYRSEQDFQLYAPEEELALCQKIYRPMLPGSILSWIAFLITLWLAARVSGWFGILSVLLAVYAGICTCLGISYSRLIRRLKEGHI